MGQCVDLPNGSWNSWSYQSVWWKRNWSSLTISIYMERVSPELIKILVHITAAVNIDHGLKFEAIVEFDFTIFYYFFFIYFDKTYGFPSDIP